MSKQKKLRTRLEDLFSDLEEQAAQPAIEVETIPGWTWECNSQGIYTHCSPEILNVLGIHPKNMVGQSMFTFGLDDSSRVALRSVFDNGDFPCELELNFLSSQQKIVSIRTHLFPIESIDNTHRGWRGFNHVISSVSGIHSQQPALPLHQPATKTSPRRLKRTIEPTNGTTVVKRKLTPSTSPPSISAEVSIQEHKPVATDAAPGSPATLSVPVGLQEYSLGILELYDDTPNRKWTKDEKRLVEQVADQLALALENAHLFQETQISLSRTEALYNVSQAAIGFENLGDLLQAVVDTITETLPADRTQVAIFNIDISELTHFYESNHPPLDIGENSARALMDGLSGWCIRERKPALSPKNYEDPRESPIARGLRKRNDIGSLIVVPLAYREEVFGTIIGINTKSQRDFNQSDLDLLETMANQVATALANARLFQEEQRRRQIADTLSETARVVGATLELEDVGSRLLAQLSEVVPFDTASLQFVEGDYRRLISGIDKTAEQHTEVPLKSLPPISEDPVIQQIVSSGTVLVIPDTKSDPRWYSHSESRQIRSWIGAPLLSGIETIGLLLLGHSKPGTYDSETANLISAIAAQVSVAIRNAGLFQQVQRRSVQLLTAAEVSRAASSILEPNPLIQQTVNLIRDRFNLYYVGLFLVDQTGEWTNEPGRWVVLRAGTGEAGRIQIERGHKLSIGNESMIGECVLTATAQTPRTISDGTPRFANPLLPDTKTEIALPLISRGQVIGAMSIQSRIADAFHNEDVAVLQTMADQVANALQNANLFNQTQARADELLVLNEMSRNLSQNLEINTILKNVYLFASRLIDTSTFFVALHNPNSDEISFPFATEDNREITIPTRPLGTGLTEYVIQNRETVLIHEQVEDWLKERGIEMRLTGALPQSWLGVPLAIGEQTLGIICVQHQERNHFSNHHKDLMNAIANQSAIAVQNAQLFAQTQEALSDTEALLNISSVASSSLELQETLSNVLQQVLNTIGSEAGLITIAESRSQKLTIVAHQLPDTMLRGIQGKGLDDSLCDWVYKHETPLVLDNLVENSPVDSSGLILLGFNSYQGVPLEAKGRVLGTLCTFSTHRLSPNVNDISLLQAVGRQIGVAVENANLFEQTQAQAVELTVLNEMSRVLSTLFNINEIIQTIHEFTSRLVDTSNFFVGLYDAREDEISFPLVIEQGAVTSIPKMKKRRGLTQYVIDTKQPLLITENVRQKIIALGLEEIVVGTPAESWLGVPLIIGETVLGVIAIQSANTPRAFNDHHLELLVSVARQSAIAIQTARLFQETRRQTEDLALLNELSRVLTNMLDRKEVLETVYNYASQLMDTTNFFITTFDPVHEEITYEFFIVNGHQVEVFKRLLGHGFLDHVLKTGETILLEDQLPDRIAHLGIKIETGEDTQQPASWLGVPMLVGDKVIGAIGVQAFNTPRLFNSRQRDLLLSIANQTAISLQNVQLFDQVQSAFKETTVLYQAGAELNAAQSYQDILNVLRNHTILGVDASSISINLFDRPGTEEEPSDRQLPIARWSQKPFPQTGPLKFPVTSSTPAQSLMMADVPTIIDDPANDPRLDEISREMYLNNFGAKSLVFAPLVLAGIWLGYVQAIFSRRHSFSDSEIRRMMTLVGQSAVAIQNLRSLEDSIRKAGQLETAAEIARDTSATLSVNELIDRSVNAVCERFGYYHASTFLIDDSRKKAVVRASTGQAGAEMMQQGHHLLVGSQSVIGKVTESGEPLLVNDVSQSKIHRPNPLLPDTKSELGIPLKIGDQVIGALDVQSIEKNAFTNDDVAVLQTLADQISVAIDNARSYQLAQEAIDETRRRVRDLTTLSAASQVLAGAPLDIHDVAAIIAHQVSDIIPEKTITSISLRDSYNPDRIKTIVTTILKDGKLVIDENPEFWDFNLSEYPLTASVIENSVSKVIHRSDQDADPYELAYMEQNEVATLLIIPLAVKGQVIGIMELETSEVEYDYSHEEINLLTTLANQAAISLENARLYQEQLESAEQLRELDKLKSQFLANMSHELRTPLNSIIGFSRVIMKGIDGPITQLQQQDLSAIYNAGQHLLKMINDILDISKIDAGKMDLAFEDVNLTDIITSVMSTARGLVKDKAIQLITAIDENLPVVNADPTRIRQILLNLLSNAAKFTDEGSITVAARQEINANGKPEIYVSVADTGMGIAPEDHDRLFEPFVQVDGSPTRATGGTGLGLSITRMLVELHNGEIGLESEVGKGSNFYFTLPLDNNDFLPQDTDGNLTILAIDDDLQVIQLYERYLSNTDFQIVPLGDPSSAVTYAQQIQPILITLDIMLPNHDGWGLLESLKKDPKTSHIPIIICSIRDETEKGLALGADDYLVKPILAEDFLNAINQLAEKNKQAKI